MGQGSAEKPARDRRGREDLREWIPQAPPAPKSDADAGLLDGARKSLGAIADGTNHAEFLGRCAARSRDRAYLIDVDRLAGRALARLAWWSRTRSAAGTGEAEPMARRDDAIDASIDDLLRLDQLLIARRGGLPRAEDEAYRFVEHAFGLEPGQGLLAVVRFNELPPSSRLPFFALVMEGRTIEDCQAAGLGSPEELGARARQGLEAILLMEPAERQAGVAAQAR